MTNRGQSLIRTNEDSVQWHISVTAGRVTYICVSKLTIIGSDHGLSTGRRQAIIWTNAGILLIRPTETKVTEILIEIFHIFSFKKIHLKMLSGKWRPFCLGPNVFIGDFILVSPVSAARFLRLLGQYRQQASCTAIRNRYIPCIKTFLTHLSLVKKKLPAFRRWHFRMHFYERNVLYFEWNFTEVCSRRFTWQ